MKDAVLAMAYGSPRGLDDVGAYYTNILRRPPSQELLEELTARYRTIGGKSPLLEITRAQAAALQERLGVPVYVGQKFNNPFIGEAIERIASDGIARVVGLVLAPHYSTMSVGDYERRARDAAAEAGYGGTIEVVECWHLEPQYIALLRAYVLEALERIPSSVRPDTHVVFTAHSLPARILESGDPYAEQLLATAQEVARTAGLERWRIGWQSAARTADPWIGPDVLEVVRTLAAQGARGVVVCPCGFVADHLEVLYDVDIETAQAADDAGLAFARTRMPNTDPRFIGVLASVCGRVLYG